MVARRVCLGSWVVLALACAACSTTGGAAAGPAVDPCAVEDSDLDALPLRATGCIAWVDGVVIPPHELHVRSRYIHVSVLRAKEASAEVEWLDLEELRAEFLVELVEGEVLRQELDRLGYTIDDATHREVVAKWQGDYALHEELMREMVSPGLTYEDIDRMHRGWSRARAYVCSVRDCVATQADMLVVFAEYTAKAEEEGEVFGSFEENAFAMRMIAEDRRWVAAYEDVMGPLMEKANIERFPENVVINEGYEERKR